MSTGIVFDSDTRRTDSGNRDCPVEYSSCQPSRRGGSDLPLRHSPKEEPCAALKIDRRPAVGVHPTAAGFGSGTTHPVRIACRSPGDRLTPMSASRMAWAGWPRRTRESRGSRSTPVPPCAARMNTGWPIGATPFEPHRRGTLETGARASAQPLLPDLSPQAQQRFERPDTAAGRRHLLMNGREVRKGRAGVGGERDATRGARGRGNAKGKTQNANRRTTFAFHREFCILPFAPLIFFSIASRSTSCPSPLSARVHAAIASERRPRRA